MRNLKPLRIFILALLVPVMAVAGFVRAEDRPALFDFEPAYPDSVGIFKIPSNITVSFRFETYINFNLEIDKKGQVKKILADNPKDSVFIKYYSNYLNSLTFQPAKYKDKIVKSKLPIRIYSQRSNVKSNFIFPVNDSMQIGNDLLFNYCFELNRFEIPKVTYFPSYFLISHRNDSTSRYPYLLLKLSLDKKGKLTALETIQSTAGSFEEELKSAVLYAEFSPLKKKGKKSATEVYLFISAFRQVDYPTSPMTAGERAAGGIHQKLSLQIMPYLNEYLALPIPDLDRPDIISRSNLGYYTDNTSSAYISIDSLGQPRVLQQKGVSRILVKQIKHYFSNIKYYPALDSAGRAVEFSGLIQFIPVNNENIRIKHSWLPL